MLGKPISLMPTTQKNNASGHHYWWRGSLIKALLKNTENSASKAEIMILS